MWWCSSVDWLLVIIMMWGSRVAVYDGILMEWRATYVWWCSYVDWPLVTIMVWGVCIVYDEMEINLDGVV